MLSSGSRPSFLCAPLQERALLKKLKGTGDGAVDIFFRQASKTQQCSTPVPMCCVQFTCPYRCSAATCESMSLPKSPHPLECRCSRRGRRRSLPDDSVRWLPLGSRMCHFACACHPFTVQVQQAWEEAFPFADKKALKAARLVGLKEHPQVGKGHLLWQFFRDLFPLASQQLLGRQFGGAETSQHVPGMCICSLKSLMREPIHLIRSLWRSCAAATEPSSPASWPPW